MADARVALVVGAGDYIGAAIAKRFAAGGLTVAVGRRKADKLAPLVAEIEAAGGRARAFALDARDEANVESVFKSIESELGPLEVVVFNPGANVQFGVTETTSRVFRKVWEMACFGGFLVGREAARHMVPRGQGTILFTGATASVRGSAQFAAFAAAKGGLRQVAQSMARELGPQGIHVASVIIDGMIDSQRVRERFPERVAQLPEDGMLKPADIAEIYFQIHRQPRSAWTFEADLRPYAEKF